MYEIKLTVHLDGDGSHLGLVDLVVPGHTADLLAVHLAAQPQHHNHQAFTGERGSIVCSKDSSSSVQYIHFKELHRYKIL